MSAHDGEGARRGRLRKCSACNRARELEPVTLGFAQTADGPFYLRTYTYLCDECRQVLAAHDEMIGTTLEAAVCTMLRAMGRKRA